MKNCMYCNTLQNHVLYYLFKKDCLQNGYFNNHKYFLKTIKTSLIVQIVIFLIRGQV